MLKNHRTRVNTQKNLYVAEFVAKKKNRRFEVKKGEYKKDTFIHTSNLEINTLAFANEI